MRQEEALDILKMGHNVYLTGAAGSGKTYVLNTFIRYLRKHKVRVGVTASTGIAATHMNGMTIHSWAGIGISDSLTEDHLERLHAKAPLKKRIGETKVLIIDEISMLHGKRLDMIEEVCRRLRGAEKPFGGIQVILSGDLFQLPPVSRQGDKDFVFQSNAWKNMKLKICYLDEQHRQNDSQLLDILMAIRSSDVDESHFEQLSERFKEPPKGEVVTRLYTHNSSVDQINEQKLKSISGEEHIYTMTGTGSKKQIDTLKSTCLAPEILILKAGAKVMFVANNQAGQFVNGTLGKVIGFDDENAPIVQTDQRTIHVSPHAWKISDGEKVRAEISQLPLRLAWAITVHKSQGMSLDAAEIDLSKSFEPGMGYVALSRVRDLEGLYIKGINNTAMIVNDYVQNLDTKLKTKSESVQNALATMKPEKINAHHRAVRKALRSDEEKLLDEIDQKLYEKLKKWRLKQAKKQDAPAYVVLPDTTLKLIASIKPQNEKDLSKIKGIGPAKLEKYATDILSVISTKVAKVA